jgi:predicted nuclease of predicted toxin-antitoxin system
LLKFLVDESTGLKVHEELKQMGFDTLSVIEIMRGAEDIEVMQKATEENRIIITNDKDFGWLAALYKPPGIILLRLREDSSENRIRITRHVIEKHRDAIYGSLIIASETKVRIRRL